MISSKRMLSSIQRSLWARERGYNPFMDDQQTFTSEISLRIKDLRVEHRTLDIEIGRLMTESPSVDQLLLQRLKKRKLWLKDMIVKLESQRIPDLDA
jgi:hypothetical protein